MQLPNTLEFVAACLALTRIGAVPVMALRAHREREVLHFVRSAGACCACGTPVGEAALAAYRWALAEHAARRAGPLGESAADAQA